MPSSDVPTNAGIVTLIGVILGIVYKVLSSAWETVRKWGQDRDTNNAKRDTRSVQFIEEGREGLVEWGTRMTADNDRLREENDGLRSQLDVVRADLARTEIKLRGVTRHLDTANERIVVLERTIEDLGTRLLRLEANGTV